MLETLKINGFRGHEERIFNGLARINLLVGRNNSGKTAVLDAVELLVRDGHPRTLASLARRRSGEFASAFGYREADPLPPSVRYLFYGYGEAGTASFTLASTGTPARALEVTWEDRSEDGAYPGAGLIEMRRDDSADIEKLGVGSISVPPVVVRRRPELVQFAHPLGASAAWLRPSWEEKIAGNPEEEEVLAAMQILDDRLERIVFLSEAESENIFVRLRGVRERVPLSSLGDGMRRLLGIAIRAAKAQNGWLLLDEVDSGLHFSAMSRLWRWLCVYAAKAGVQVFATTHNSDCINALGWLHRAEPTLTESVALFRIDPSEAGATRYSAEELRVVAEEALEVRA